MCSEDPSSTAKGRSQNRSLKNGLISVLLPGFCDTPGTSGEL